MNPVSINEIEDNLLSLPHNSELERQSLQLRLQACYIAALYGAEFWKLKKLTGYAEPVVSQAVKKMDDNDVIVDGKNTESFARIRTKADALIDRILGIGQTTAPTEAPAKPASRLPVKKATTRSKIARLAMMEVGARGAAFGWSDVADALRVQGQEKPDDFKIPFNVAAKKAVARGELVIARKPKIGGANPSPTLFALPGHAAAPDLAVERKPKFKAKSEAAQILKAAKAKARLVAGTEGAPTVAPNPLEAVMLVAEPDEFVNNTPVPQPFFGQKELQNLHDEKLADVQAIARVLRMFGWEAA
jgi:hypothetical protein